MIRSSASRDHGGVLVAHGDEALALVARRRRLPGLRELRVDDQVPELALQLVHAVHGAHPAATLPAQVGRARGVLTRRAARTVRAAPARPTAVEVDVVAEADHGGQLGAGRPGADLRDGHRAVGAAEPLHVGEARRARRAPAGGRADLDRSRRTRGRRCRGAARPSTGSTGCAAPPAAAAGSPRSTPTPCSPPIVHAVERVLVADEELLQQARPRPGAAGWRRASCAARRRRRGGRWPAPRRPPAAWRRAGTRPPRRTPVASSVRRDELVARARHARPREHRLHPRLVPHVVGGGGVHARDAQRVADLGQRHLQLLEGADQPFDRPQLPLRPARRASAICCGSSASSTCQCAGEVAAPARGAPAPRTRW